jgi:glycogen(starch) synthase
MNILISTVFYPSTGGIETVNSILSHEWTKLGHNVRIATNIPASSEHKSFPFEVFHRPSARKLNSLVRWSDVYLQGNISFKTLWPLVINRKCYVATHHGMYRRDNGTVGWQDWLKRKVARHAINISCSEAVARDLHAPCVTIHNPYNDEVFLQQPEAQRNKEIVFVGRLVSDKGVNLLLDALFQLQKRDLFPNVTIIGDGPERSALERQTHTLKLRDQVIFTGRKSPDEVARLLNQHKVLVVPSLWQEPFGVVAIEGIACGCVVVGSEGGGLKEAIGPCGLTFRNGDSARLAEQLSAVLTNETLMSALRSPAEDHLSRHLAAYVARRYLEVIEECCASGKKH